jgi:Fe2+ transport system protein B
MYVAFTLALCSQIKVPMIVVGNKCDMIKKREVELKDAKEITKNYGCPLLESSAKNDININEIFFSLIDQVCFIREGGSLLIL